MFIMFVSCIIDQFTINYTRIFLESKNILLFFSDLTIILFFSELKYIKLGSYIGVFESVKIIASKNAIMLNLQVTKYQMNVLSLYYIVKLSN